MIKRYDLLNKMHEGGVSSKNFQHFVGDIQVFVGDIQVPEKYRKNFNVSN
jgi:hypothetical protein